MNTMAMPTSLQTLIPLLSSIALLLTMTNARSPLPGKKTFFNYTFNNIKPTDLTYQGDAFFPSEIPYLRLTKTLNPKTDFNGDPVQYSTGRVLYTTPVLLWDTKNKQADFEATIKFIIRPRNGDIKPADGIVFFVAPVGTNPADGGGHFGIFDANGNNPVFAAEFDIYVNDDFDPSFRHVGIDIGSCVSKNVTEVDDAILGQEVTARVSYTAATKLIRVVGSSAMKSFEVSYVYDLSTLLPQLVQVGIAGTTGMSVAFHDVISWSFRSQLRHVKKA